MMRSHDHHVTQSHWAHVLFLHLAWWMGLCLEERSAISRRPTFPSDRALLLSLRFPTPLVLALSSLIPLALLPSPAPYTGGSVVTWSSSMDSTCSDAACTPLSVRLSTESNILTSTARPSLARVTVLRNSCRSS